MSREDRNARAERYRKNRDKARAQCAAYYARNAEALKAKARAYEASHREQSNASHLAWRAANPEKAKAVWVRFRAANLDKELKRCAVKRADPRYKEKQKATGAAWAMKNPDRRRVMKQNRRAKECADGGRLSPGIVEKLMALQRGKCACCRCEIGARRHLDHVEPIALGGAHEDRNMQLLCPPCNLSKHAKHPVEFMQSRGFLL